MDGWPDDARARLEAVIAAHGRGAAGYDAAQPPVAVFDWDNTTARGDVGDLAFAYMLDHDLIRWPERGIESWGALTPVARARIEASCPAGLPAGAPLPTRGESPCGATLARIVLGGEIDGSPAFDPAIGPHYRGTYGMMVRVFAGLSAEAAREIGEATVARALARPVGSRRTIGGVEIDDFLRVQEPVHALDERLREAGFDVWIVSASFEPLVRVFAARAGFAPDRVIGARLETSAAGLYLPTHPFERTLGPLITFDEGKRFWIRHAIFGLSPERAIAAPIDGDRRPVLAGGDSDTDHAMLAYATAMRVLFDRGARRVTCLARAEPSTFIVLPQFVDPVAHAPVDCPTPSEAHEDPE
jgi:phosphoserine phosphatase